MRDTILYILRSKICRCIKVCARHTAETTERSLLSRKFSPPRTKRRLITATAARTFVARGKKRKKET